MAILADASRLLGNSLDSDQILFTVTRMAVPNFSDGVVIHRRIRRVSLVSACSTRRTRICSRPFVIPRSEAPIEWPLRAVA